MTKVITKGTIIDHLSNLIVNDELLASYTNQQLQAHYPEIVKAVSESPDDDSNVFHRLYWSALCSIHQSLLGSVIDGFNYTATKGTEEPKEEVVEQALNDPSTSLPYEIDNRDLNETWLRINGRNERVDIDPMDMIRNAMENSSVPEQTIKNILDTIALEVDKASDQE